MSSGSVNAVGLYYKTVADTTQPCVSLPGERQFPARSVVPRVYKFLSSLF